MGFKEDWLFIVQSKLRMPLHDWLKKRKIVSYEEAVNALKRSGLPVGTRDEVVAQLPVSPKKNASDSDSDSSTRSSSVVRNKKSSVTKKRAPVEDSKEPKSPAEKAADAITKSVAVKAPKAKTARKRRTKKSPTKK